MSANRDVFSSVRLQLESDNGQLRVLPDPLSAQKLSTGSIASGDKKHKWSVFRKNSSTVSRPGELELYEDDTSTNMPSLSTYLKSLSGIAELEETKRAAGGGGHGYGVSFVCMYVCMTY